MHSLGKMTLEWIHIRPNSKHLLGKLFDVNIIFVQYVYIQDSQTDTTLKYLAVNLNMQQCTIPQKIFNLSSRIRLPLSGFISF